MIMRHNLPPSPLCSDRRGSTIPLVAAALLIAMGGLALVVDRLWLDAARWELTAAAEAAALAAARELATDERLKRNYDVETAMEAARAAAAEIAQQNRVAGHPAPLDAGPEGDIRFGQMVVDEETEQPRFDEAVSEPSHVVVTAQRTRERNNPVALFIGELTGQPWGDVASRVQASIDNHVEALRPLRETSAPVVPLAIWQRDPTGQQTETWQHAIEQRHGGDRYSYDAEQELVVRRADGIPELTLRSQRRNGSANDANVLLLDLGSQLEPEVLEDQYAHGLKAEHLAQWQGELPRGSVDHPISLLAASEFLRADFRSLRDIVGEPRICCLFTAGKPTSNRNRYEVQCVDFVAIRIMKVSMGSDGVCEMVVQPTVIASRTIRVAANGFQQDIAPNPYLFRLSLTN